MRLGQALQRVMQRWDITAATLARESGVIQAVISKLLRGEQESASWVNVERMIKGFEKIDPLACAAFIKALQIPDDSHLKPPLGFPGDKLHDPDNIKEIVKVLEGFGVLDKAKLREVEREWTGLKIWHLVSKELQIKRHQQLMGEEDGENS